MDAREAVALWISGDKKKVEKSYQAARTINPQLKTVSQCEKQLARWNQEIHAEGTAVTSDTGSVETPIEQDLTAIAEGVRLFDDTTMLLLKVLSDLDFDIYGERKSQSEVLAYVAQVVSGLINLVGAGINPKTSVDETLEELRSVCISDSGEITKDICSKIPEACNNVAEEIMAANVIRDMTRIL